MTPGAFQFATNLFVVSETNGTAAIVIQRINGITNPSVVKCVSRTNRRSAGVARGAFPPALRH